MLIFHTSFFSNLCFNEILMIDNLSEVWNTFVINMPGSPSIIYLS